MKKCSVPKCDKQVLALTLCTAHYNAYRKTGTLELLPKEKKKQADLRQIAKLIKDL